LTPAQAQYWHDVVAWGQTAKAMHTGADGLAPAMILVGGEVWEVLPGCATCGEIAPNENTSSN